MYQLKNLPPLLLPFSRKTKDWRRKHCDWADSRTFFNDSLVRKTILHKRVNYDLVNGRLNMKDMELVINPDKINAGYIPEEIQHYPIINSKLNVLRGEEFRRTFDFRAIVTNPNSISEIEVQKKEELNQRLQLLIADTSLSEEEYSRRLELLDNEYTYTWQDEREIRANAIINHYVKEYNMPVMFNHGFMDGMVVGEEIYLCDIVGGEPTIERLNPLKVRIFRSGYSNKIEDADVIIITDYWSMGRIIDTFYDVLSDKDIKYLEALPLATNSDEMDNRDPRDGFVLADAVGAFGEGYLLDSFNLFAGGPVGNNYYDSEGNIRITRVYWKSRRKIKKVKSFNIETGEEEFNFYPETYILNEAIGEEEAIFWIDEAWEGTKIGRDIYVNMRPRVVQYNRLLNPSRCHFGIVGSLYNLNDSRPFSLVDLMKPYAYLYDAVHDRLNKAIASHWGTIMEVDLASIPKGWKLDKWLYYARINNVAFKDSFKAGNEGVAKGKLAGNFANSTRGMLSADNGNYILLLVNILEFIKLEMAEVAGISKLREGQISNRETVGGIERATLQSSHITEWLFMVHDDVKKRALECFLETAKIAMKGRNIKFQYILSDTSLRIMDIDGDLFAESDYGIVVDNSPLTLLLNDKIDTLALAALLNQALDFSAIFKLYTTMSLSEKIRLIEKNEAERLEMLLLEALANREVQLQVAEMAALTAEAERESKEAMNTENNETKLLIEAMKLNASNETSEDVEYSPQEKERLLEEIRLFNKDLGIKEREVKVKERLASIKDKEVEGNLRLKKQEINKKPNPVRK